RRGSRTPGPHILPPAAAPRPSLPPPPPAGRGGGRTCLWCPPPARHYRELSNKNQLRPQDVMRILVHCHAYGDAAKAARLVKSHSNRLRGVIDADEAEEVGRLTAEYQPVADKLAAIEGELAEAEKVHGMAATKADKSRAEKRVAQLTRTTEKLRKQLAERDERIAEARKRAAEERQAIEDVGEELIKLYADPAELGKHARVVEMAEVEENEYNLNIPRYVDTFEPEEPIDVDQALAELEQAEKERQTAERELRKLLKGVGYGV